MPYGDKTGPRGYGPRSGRGMGYCTGHTAPGCEMMHPRRGGMGYRHGQRHMFRMQKMHVPYERYDDQPMNAYEPEPVRTAPPEEDEETYLARMEASLKEELAYVQKRLKNTKKGTLKSEQE